MYVDVGGKGSLVEEEGCAGCRGAGSRCGGAQVVLSPSPSPGSPPDPARAGPQPSLAPGRAVRAPEASPAQSGGGRTMPAAFAVELAAPSGGQDGGRDDQIARVSTTGVFVVAPETEDHLKSDAHSLL